MAEILKLPYLVDPHVHFRTPGQEYKENFDTGSSAALAGGVTMVLDMPNNLELVTNVVLLKRKKEIAEQQTRCDIGFILGSLGDIDQDFSEAEKFVYGLKLYMNNTTGGFTVSDPKRLESIFRRWDFPKPILVHAEGDTLKSAISLAEKYDRRLHVCHVSLASEVDQVKRAKDKRGGNVSSEVTPHHLFESNLWSDDSFRQMKPPLSGFGDMQALWDGLNDGTIDIIATDHAPHSRLEKESETPPSGVTGLETTLPVLLMAERAGRISLKKIQEVTHINPIRIFDLPEQKDSHIEVLRGEPYEVRGENLQTKVRLTPFEGRRLLDKVAKVTLRGLVVFENNQVLASPGSGKVLF